MSCNFESCPLVVTSSAVWPSLPSIVWIATVAFPALPVAADGFRSAYRWLFGIRWCSANALPAVNKRARLAIPSLFG